MKKLFLQAGMAIIGGAGVVSASVSTPAEVTTEYVVETYNYEQVHEINVSDIYKINGQTVSYEEWLAYKEALDSGVLTPIVHNDQPPVDVEAPVEAEPAADVKVHLYGTMTNAQLLDEYVFELENGIYTFETSLKKDDFFLVEANSTYYGADILKSENTVIKPDAYGRLVAQVDGNYLISFDGESIEVELKGMEFLDNVVFADSEGFYDLITTEGTHFDYLAVYNQTIPSGNNNYGSSVCGVYQTVNYNNELLHFVTTAYTKVLNAFSGTLKYLNLSCFEYQENVDYSQYLVNCHNCTSPGSYYGVDWSEAEYGSGIYILTNVTVQGYHRSSFGIGLIPIEQTVLTYENAYSLEQLLDLVA